MTDDKIDKISEIITQNKQVSAILKVKKSLAGDKNLLEDDSIYLKQRIGGHYGELEVIKLRKKKILSLDGLHNVEKEVIIFLFYLILYTQHYGKERSPGVRAKNDLPVSGQRTIFRRPDKERSPGVRAKN